MRNADYTGKLFCGILRDDEVVVEEAMVVEVKGGFIFEFTDVWRVVDSEVWTVAKGRWTGKKYADFKSLGIREISDSLWDALVNKNRMCAMKIEEMIKVGWIDGDWEVIEWRNESVVGECAKDFFEKMVERVVLFKIDVEELASIKAALNKMGWERVTYYVEMDVPEVMVVEWKEGALLHPHYKKVYTAGLYVMMFCKEDDSEVYNEGVEVKLDTFKK